MSKHKRTIKLVHKPFQLKLIGIFFSIACFAVVVQVLLLAQSFVAVSATSGTVGEQVRTQLPSLLGKDMLLSIGFLLPFMLLVGINATHKIAGPVYRVDQHLNKVIETGSNPGSFHLRNGDELQGLVSALNAALERLEGDRLQQTPEAA